MRIALVSEGTYPFAMGGVSTWCDQLIRGIDEHDWEVVALTVAGTEQPLWTPPEQLRVVHNVALWSPDPRPRSSRPGRAFLQAYEQYCRALVTPLSDDPTQAGLDRVAFLSGLRGLFDLAQVEGLADLSCDAALRQLIGAWSAQHTVGLSLRDALEWTTLMDHLLRPLFWGPIDVDVVHSSMNGPSMLVAMAAAWAHGTPVIMSEHGIYLRERYLLREADLSPAATFLRLNFFRLLAGAGYLISDAIAPHSRYNRRWELINGADPGRMLTMYNGVEPEQFPLAHAEPETPTISFLGRIDPIKDLHTLIRGFGIVHERMPQARLRMYGAAPAGQEEYLAGCEALIAELGLRGAATFEGPTSDPVSAYHAGTIVALSSMSEGFPYTVVEAMACGRPVVHTNVGGVSEAVADAGMMVPPKDYRALGEAAHTMLTDHRRRREMAGRARQRVIEWFSLSRWTNAYRFLYDEVVSARTESASVAGLLEIERTIDTVFAALSDPLEVVGGR